MIDYRHYRLSNRASYPYHDVDLSIEAVNLKVDLLYPTLELFSGKDPMEILGFLSTMAEAFNGQRLSKGFASRSLAIFLTASPQKEYTNVVYPKTNDPNRVHFTWPLIVH